MTYNPVVTLVDGNGTVISSTNPLPTGTTAASTTVSAKLVDANGLPIRTTVNGDGTASVGGAVTFLTYPSSARTTNNAGDSFSTENITSLAVDTNVTVFTGGSSPNITFLVQRFAADGLWYTVWTSSAVSTVVATSVSIGPGLTGTGTAAAVLSGTARFGWTLGGSPTSITFSASVIGR